MRVRSGLCLHEKLYLPFTGCSKTLSDSVVLRQLIQVFSWLLCEKYCKEHWSWLVYGEMLVSWFDLYLLESFEVEKHICNRCRQYINKVLNVDTLAIWNLFISHQLGLNDLISISIGKGQELFLTIRLFWLLLVILLMLSMFFPLSIHYITWWLVYRLS